MLTGVRANGTRLKQKGLSRVEAERMGAQIFGFGGAPVVVPIAPTPTVTQAAQLDDWGLPLRIKQEDVADLNASLGIKPQPAAPPPPPEDAEKREKRAKTAKSLADMLGTAWTGGVVYAGRRLCEKTDRDAAGYKPNPEQVKDLREVTKDTITEMFGDHEVPAWQMMIFLSIGIPLAMFIQIPKRPKEKSETSPGLRAVPSREG
jgi:hypothetical protein